jgi:hypothetical protein
MSREQERLERVEPEQICACCLQRVTRRCADLGLRQLGGASQEEVKPQQQRTREGDASCHNTPDRCGLDLARAACLCIERGECCTARSREIRRSRAWDCQHQSAPPPLLYSSIEHITAHRTVSKRAVGTGGQAFIHSDSPATPVNEKSAGRGEEAALNAAEESASSDCASEAAGEVCSSAAVSMEVDMMCCVQGRSARSERRKEEI